MGRLPVKAVFERLSQKDLLKILQNPNNPVLLNKKLDFATYGIQIKFSDNALNLLAHKAYKENTGARGLVSVIEQVLIPFETKLPSTNIKRFPVTVSVIENPERTLNAWLNETDDLRLKDFETIAFDNKKTTKSYLTDNRTNLTNQYGLPLSPYRIDKIAEYYCNNVTEIGHAVKKIKSFYEKIKKIEIEFYNKHDINIVLEDDAIDFILEKMATGEILVKSIYEKLTADFEYGLKLIREKTERNRFFLSKKALMNPDDFIKQIIKTEFKKSDMDASLDLEFPDYKPEDKTDNPGKPS